MFSKGTDSVNSVNGNAQGRDRHLNCSADGSCNGILEDEQQGGSSYKLLILSASDEDGVARQARSLSALSTDFPQDDKQILEDVVFTLNTCRTMLEWKSYCTLETLSQLAEVEQSLSKAVRRPTATDPSQ